MFIPKQPKFKYIILLLVILPVLSYCQNNKANIYANEITIAELQKHVRTLAADSMAGRSVEDSTICKSAHYIMDQIAQSKISPVTIGDTTTYFQSFILMKEYWDEMYLEIDGQRYENYRQWAYLSSTDISQRQETKLKFVGNLDKAKDDLNDLAISSFNTSHWNKRSREFKDQANAYFILSGKDSLEELQSFEMMKRIHDRSKIYFPGNDQEQEKAQELPTFLLFANLAQSIYQLNARSYSRLSSSVDLSNKEISKELPSLPIAYKAAKKKDSLEVVNVLGYIEGSEKPDELVVISAHYDHLGVNALGEVYNGADDNASGVAAILEIGESFQKASESGLKPKRSILILAVTGEERGLYGSKYYVKDPVFPLHHTVANLNVDMIGRRDNQHSDTSNYIYLIGSDKLSQDLHRLSERVNRETTQLVFDYRYNADDDPNRFYYRSDHYNFAKHNIPVIFYFNGTHEDYHEVTDTAGKIDFDILQKRAQLIFYTAWEIANREERLQLNEQGDSGMP